MKAAVLKEKGVIEIEEREMPKTGDDDVLVKIEYVGVCGSDLHFYGEGGIGVAKIYEPRVLGHEPVGKVESIGKNVTDLKEGDSVILEPGIGCGHCSFCRTGRYNICPTAVRHFLGNPWTDGVFQEYIAYPYQYVYKIPDDFPKLRGVMIEPYVVVLHAVERSGARYGHSAVILGAGCIGIMTMLALRAHGVGQIFLVDIVGNRLKKAQEFGTVHTINAKMEDPVQKVLEMTAGAGTDLVFETAGSIITQAQTVQYVKKTGMITFVGFSSGQPVAFDISTLMRKEANVTTVFRYANQHRKALDQMIINPIELEKLVSHIYDLKDIKKALDENIRDKDKVIKAVIRI
ncbi:MAG: NAD(P)-dependent alcohol dehydrogenase [Anaerolineaceae bacterium]|nr:MAG: NAD(P)-dependent alcohol dehydrogenase [Anaerolineaceae bacterium]